MVAESAAPGFAAAGGMAQLVVQLAQARAQIDRLWLALDAAEDDARRYRWLRGTTRCLWRPVALRNVADGDQADAMVDAAMRDDQ